MDARHGRSTLTAPHPAHIAHDNSLFTEYAGLTSPALESGEWHMRPACASRARLESRAPVISERCDWNGNITSVQEVIPGGMNVTSTFVYDYENRLTEYAVGGTNFSVEHTYDGYNRLVKTDATIGANTQNFEHVYAGRQHLGNIETTGQPVNGKVWKWEAGAGMPNAGPIESPQRLTASATQFYMVSDERNVERKSYRVASITAGDYNDDSRYAEWQQVNGNVVPTRPALMAYKSEMFNAYQVTLDADRASSAATNHALQLAASDLEYEGTRVKSPVLGRDLNPMGRGDGAYYADGGNTHGGSVAVRGAKVLYEGHSTIGYGSSVNNKADWDFSERVQWITENTACPIKIGNCIAYVGPDKNRCEGIDVYDSVAFCCECIPLICVKGPGGCTASRGSESCEWVPDSGFEEYCRSHGHPPKERNDGGCCGGEPGISIGEGVGITFSKSGSMLFVFSGGKLHRTGGRGNPDWPGEGIIGGHEGGSGPKPGSAPPSGVGDDDGSYHETYDECMKRIMTETRPNEPYNKQLVDAIVDCLADGEDISLALAAFKVCIDRRGNWLKCAENAFTKAFADCIAGLIGVSSQYIFDVIAAYEMCRFRPRS